MAAPATVDEFLDLVRKSGVVEEDRLSGHLQSLTAASPLPANTNELAARLIRDGLLTQFQARQLLLGKWRRFLIGGKYKLLELLGAGGMGAVYLCEHIFMRRLVALKVLPSDKITDPSMVERFYREARASAALDHPNIVRAYDIDHFDGLHFLVMEYIEGSSLHEIVARHGPMDVTRAAHYIAQSAAGLQYAHEKGLVHRDIKPGNLLLDRSGTVKILDLGLARFFGNKTDSVTEKYDERTVLGTADYLAPEQAVQSQVDIRADIYSLGATLYYLLTGRAPFHEGTIAQKLVWHQMKEPVPVRQIRPEVPEEFDAVLRRMMAKRADDRFQQPFEIVEALAGLTALPIDPPADKEMPRLSPAVLGAGRAVATPSVPALSGIRPALGPASRPPSRPGSVTPLPRSAPSPMQTPVGNDDGPPDTMALPRPGSEEERALMEAAGRWKADRPDSTPGEAVRAGNRVLLLVAGIVLGAVLLGGGGIFLYLWWQISDAARPIDPKQIIPGRTGETPTPPADGRVPLADVRKYARYPGPVTVEFEVKSTGVAPGLIFLNSENPSSKENFAVVLLEKAVQQLKDEKGVESPREHFKGKTVRVTGPVELYKDKPEIKVNDASQLEVVLPGA